MGKVSPQLPSFKREKAPDVRLNYSLRLTACLVVFALHASILWGDPNVPTWLWGILLGHCLIYPHVTYFLTTTVKKEQLNIMIDSFFYAFSLGVWGFNLYLVAIFVSSSNMTNLSAGGKRLLFKGALFQFAGILLCGLAMGYYYRPSLELLPMMIVTIGLILYTASLGILIFKINSSLRKNKDRLSTRQVELEHINQLAQAVNANLDLDDVMQGLMKSFETMYPFESESVITFPPN